MKSPLAAANDGEGIDLRFIGYTSEGSTDLMVEPTPAANLKNPDAIERDLAKKRVKQEAAAPLTPYCGRLTHVVVLGEEGNEPLFEVSGSTSAKQLIQWLEEQYPNRLGASIKGDPSYVPGYFLGFNIKSMFEMACKQVLVHNQTVKRPIKVPVRLWYNPAGLLHDVADCAISSGDRDVLSLNSVLQALGIEADAEQLVTDVNMQAQVARELTQKLQLFGQWTD